MATVVWTATLLFSLALFRRPVGTIASQPATASLSLPASDPVLTSG
jgi:hypothetical protein